MILSSHLLPPPKPHLHTFVYWLGHSIMTHEPINTQWLESAEDQDPPTYELLGMNSLY